MKKKSFFFRYRYKTKYLTGDQAFGKWSKSTIWRRKKIDCSTFSASDLLIVRTNARKFDFTRCFMLNRTDSIKLATEVRDCWESDLLHRDICKNWPESNIVSNLKDFLDEEFQF